MRGIYQGRTVHVYAEVVLSNGTHRYLIDVPGDYTSYSGNSTLIFAEPQLGFVDGVRSQRIENMEWTYDVRILGSSRDDLILLLKQD